MDILEDFFYMRGFRYLRLDGSTSSEEREQRMYQVLATITITCTHKSYHSVTVYVVSAQLILQHTLLL
jgi:hypothetical protein